MTKAPAIPKSVVTDTQPWERSPTVLETRENSVFEPTVVVRCDIALTSFLKNRPVFFVLMVRVA
jgi:hypothetical protein